MLRTHTQAAKRHLQTLVEVLDQCERNRQALPPIFFGPYQADWKSEHALIVYRRDNPSSKRQLSLATVAAMIGRTEERFIRGCHEAAERMKRAQEISAEVLYADKTLH